MTTRMLIDARHQEETRVAVLKGNRIEEFDFESAEHKQIKGNIYLAKVTRVEPSLQAAFVDFGGNRHGFLAFSEIHPDYYQIPKEDREALLAEEAAHAEEEAALRAAQEAEDDEDDDADLDDESSDALADELAGDGVTEVDTSEKAQVATIEGGMVENGFDGDGDDSDEGDESDDDDGNGESGDEQRARSGRQRRGRRRGRSQAKEVDEVRAKRMALRRRYKIQDVIQRRQVLLVQVVKEERGNKGAALTTYLSLAGRYCVLMPNSSHGGGISRKISSAADRKRLKTIISELDLPRSMSCIVRTAGLQRTKTEIKRDFDYLARLWDGIREQTLKSSAPWLIHSDSDLVKRAIRDIYNREIEEVIVEGDDGYRAAKDFMKLLMPSHARRVKHYADPVPLFQRYGAEDQLTAMYDPVVQLKSGGYLVINPTEALVSIDINSGRSTKEHGIEATALSTNLEAAREIARQLRLRDMAGLVVIDFIDMEYGSNIRKVEKAMKEALKNDRARIQVGRISGFGLMEMSRQRLRTGVLEATTRACPHCDGSGLVRTASSAGLSALRMIEDEAAKGKGSVITLYASQEAAIYVLNAKRFDLQEIEERYGVSVEVIPEGENEGAKMRVSSRGPRPDFVPSFEPIVDDDEPEIEDEDEFEDEDESQRESGEGSGRKKRRRRRRGRNRDRADNGDNSDEQDEADASADTATDEDAGDSEETGETAEGEEDRPRKRRRRGRRRRGGPREDGQDNGEAGVDNAIEEGADSEAMNEMSEQLIDDIAVIAEPDAAAADAPAETAQADEAPAEEVKPKKRTRRKKADAAAQDTPAADAPVAEEAPAKPKRTRRKKADAEPVAEESQAAEEAPAKPKRTRRKKADAPKEEAPQADTPAEPEAPAKAEEPAATPSDAPETAVTESAEAPDAETSEDQEAPRRGWWQRTFGN
ncbi:ribonuclease E/G [Novosphingobium sp. ZN18A2]|uniref:Rne/Rng family ribonuclease n=1 Tax=Novosphingobium sp. ZN18A2 TaxID=3079861 RepID=UPI0030CFC071